MKYKGQKGIWKPVEINTNSYKSILIAEEERGDVIATLVLPTYEITPEVRATAQLMSSSLELLTALQELLSLKEWRALHGKDSTYSLNRNLAWLKAENAVISALSKKETA